MKKEICIIVDFDGTLIEGDLEQSFMKYLMKFPGIRVKMLLVALLTLPINIIRNKLGYPSLYKSWTLVLNNDIELYITRFIQEMSQSIRLKNDIWSLLDKPDAKIVLLSGCYEELLKAYLKSIGKIHIFDQIIGCTMQVDCFRVKIHPYGRSKALFVDRNKYNIGIANEKNDLYYLNLCDEQIYVK